MIVEEVRAIHEEIERYENECIEDLERRSKRLRLSPQWADATRAAPPSQVLARFVDEISTLRQLAVLDTSAPPPPLPSASAAATVDGGAPRDAAGDADEDYPPFTSGEGGGRYLHPADQHSAILSLLSTSAGAAAARAARATMGEYLVRLAVFDDIPAATKTHDYLAYLASLSSYLRSFIARTRPLDPPPPPAAEVPRPDGKASKAQRRALHVARVAAAEAEVAALAAVTAAEAAAAVAHLTAAAARTLEEEHAAAAADAAALRQALSRAHGRGEAAAAREAEKEERRTRANPLRLPEGWDGQPIPVWLFKVQGLSKEFDCEICGGVTYRGPKAFDAHFRDFRHAAGLRAMRIPNGAAFHGITTFAEATAVWERVRTDAARAAWRPQQMVECEDQDGRVVPKRVMDLMIRQGLA